MQLYLLLYSIAKMSALALITAATMSARANVNNSSPSIDIIGSLRTPCTLNEHQNWHCQIRGYDQPPLEIQFTQATNQTALAINSELSSQGLSFKPHPAGMHPEWPQQWHILAWRNPARGNEVVIASILPPSQSHPIKSDSEMFFTLSRLVENNEKDIIRSDEAPSLQLKSNHLALTVHENGAHRTVQIFNPYANSTRNSIRVMGQTSVTVSDETNDTGYCDPDYKGCCDPDTADTTGEDCEQCHGDHVDGTYGPCDGICWHMVFFVPVCDEGCTHCCKNACSEANREKQEDNTCGYCDKSKA